MRPDMVVRLEPHIDDRLGLFDARAPFCIQNLMTQSAVKAFIVAVLPGATGIDLYRLDTDLA